MFRMRLLKVAASDLMTRDLRRNRKYRHAISITIEEAIDEVKIAGRNYLRTQQSPL